MNRQIYFITLFLAFFLFATLVPCESTASEAITMYLGEVQVLEIGQVERVAIGNPSVASNTILPQGQLVLLADAAGATTMHIWLKDGKELDFEIVVNSKKVIDDYRQLGALLKDFPGISTERAGDLTIVRGQIPMQDKPQYDRILKRYEGVLDLVTSTDSRSEVALLLKDIPNLTVREVGGSTVLSGEISQEYAAIIKIVEQKYQNIMNLTRVHAAVAGKMIYMSVKIMELSKSVTEKLGINWNATGLLGPSLEFGVEASRNGGSLLNATGTTKALTAPGGDNLTSARGYFGIATQITSTIDLSLQNGDGVILAEPQLSTRSGGKAQFHAGGEFPIATTSNTGQVNIEYKKYGIILNIEPVIDDRNNILAHLETEISNIDEGQTFDKHTGLLTRNTSTDVSLKEGETLVIAGLVQDNAHKNLDRVAGLGELPILGPLFRSQDFQNKRTELVIFVTPRLYDAASPLNANQIEQGEKVKAEFKEIVKGNELLD